MTSLSTRQGVFVAFAGALLLFGPTAQNFVTRVTDISALRILDGDVPYRDFWTMYAPGSFVTMALAFKVFGREVIVSSLLGILVSAAAVAVYFRLVRVVAGTAAALLLAALFTLAFYGTGYHNGFTSYPAAILLILSAAVVTSGRCTSPGVRWAVLPGLLLGGAALYKHDIAGYAAIATGFAVFIVRARARIAPRFTPVVVLGATAGAIVLAAAAALVLVGAGPDAWEDLVRFPLVDFRYVRGEYLPLLPQLRGSLVEMVQELVRWAQYMLPLLAFVIGAIGLGRKWRELPPASLFCVAFTGLGFWLHWVAAHSQMNTNAITLAAWGGLVGVCGVSHLAFLKHRLARLLLGVAVLGWASTYVAQRTYTFATQPTSARERINLPGLAGLHAPPDRAAELRNLSAAIAAAAEPGAPLLFLSHRNDVTIYAASVPFWLTPRRPATRYHEIHPGITDIEPRQQEMVAALSAGPLPVVVREHRFPDKLLDRMKSTIQQRVPIGATTIDAWVGARYEPGPRFGSYEVMRALDPRPPR